ncbi:MAG: NADH-quinone oxidoreductase subunit C [Planctomycetota bacterium]|nr:MAG: NADH-quinone oxidoreductase subunit C [Planctomycetota bacterium]
MSDTATPSVIERFETKLCDEHAICETRKERQGVYSVPIAKLVPLLRDFISNDNARLATITGIDVRDGTELLYHLCFDDHKYVATLKVLVPRTVDAMESITPWLPGAEFIEREIHDLLGIDFTGHPRMERLILSDDWPEGVYPLRRGFKKEDAQP